MIGGQTLVMRSWHPPPLVSLFRAGGDVVFVYSSPSASRSCSRQLFSLSCDAESVRKKVIVPLSSFTEAAGLRPNSERLRFPRSAMAQPTSMCRPFSWLLLHAGCHLRNICSSRASQYSDSSVPIDSTAMQSMERKIKEQLSADAVSVKDAYGDGRHVSLMSFHWHSRGSLL